MVSLGLLAAGAPGARAGNAIGPAVEVNDAIVTTYELNQRIKLMTLLNQPGNIPAQARQSLIDDRLRHAAAVALGVSVPDAQVQQGMAAFAARGQLSLGQMGQLLNQNGIDLATLRDFVRAGLEWRAAVQAKYSSQVSVSDAEIDRAISAGVAAGGPLQVLLSEILLPTGAVPGAGANAGAGAGLDTGVAAGSGPQSGTGLSTGVVAGAEADGGTGLSTGVVAGAQADGGAGLSTGAVAGSQADGGTGLSTGAVAGSQADGGTGLSTGVVAGSGGGNGAAPGSATGLGTGAVSGSATVSGGAGATGMNRTEAMLLARRIREGATTLAAFQIYAQKYSKAPNAAAGGQMGWQPLSALPPAVAAAVGKLKPGEMTEPMAVDGGIAIYYLRDESQSAGQGRPVFDVDYAVLALANASTARSLAASATRCEDLYPLARGLPEEAVARQTVREGRLPRDLAALFAHMDPGETATRPAPGGGTQVIMLCNRVPESKVPPSRDAVRTALSNRKLALLAEAWLQQMRADAIIRNN